jgi:hypothetical protein
MSEENELIEKLEKWVTEHPDDADVTHINITTQQEFTIREFLGQLKKERDGTVILDKNTLEIKDMIKEWVEE